MGCCTLHRQPPRVGKEAVIRCTGLPPSAPVSVWSSGVASLCLGECGCCLSLDLASPRNVMQGWGGSSPAVWTHSLEAVLFVSGITGTWSAWACPLSLQAPQPQSVLQTGRTFSSRSHSLLTFGWAAVENCRQITPDAAEVSIRAWATGFFTGVSLHSWTQPSLVLT